MIRAKPLHATAMVAVLVRQQDRVDVFGLELEAPQALAELFQGKTIVDQQRGLMVLHQGRITPAAATQRSDTHVAYLIC